MVDNDFRQEVIEITRQALQLVARLERLSADSSWARRASGCRGALLKILDDAGALEGDEASIEPNLDIMHLSYLIETGYDMLERAARQIPESPV